MPPVPPSTGQAESGCPTLQVHWGTRLSRLSDLSRERWAGPRCTGITMDLGSRALPHALLPKPPLCAGPPPMLTFLLHISSSLLTSSHHKLSRLAAASQLCPVHPQTTHAGPCVHAHTCTSSCTFTLKPGGQGARRAAREPEWRRASEKPAWMGQWGPVCGRSQPGGGGASVWAGPGSSQSGRRCSPWAWPVQEGSQSSRRRGVGVASPGGGACPGRGGASARPEGTQQSLHLSAGSKILMGAQRLQDCRVGQRFPRWWGGREPSWL